MEHTTDVKVAKEIAMDHMFEDPKYYTKMEKAGIKESEKSIHDPVKPGILKKKLGKLTCTKVRAARGKLKDKGTHYAKALQRYLNYHCKD
jgi:hypothetical protein